MVHCHLDKQSPLFFLLTQLQDEVHRKAVSFHQKLRSKSQTRSILDDIDGLGEKRKKKLMNHFKSTQIIFYFLEVKVIRIVVFVALFDPLLVQNVIIGFAISVRNHAFTKKCIHKICLNFHILLYYIP